MRNSLPIWMMALCLLCCSVVAWAQPVVTQEDLEAVVDDLGDRFEVLRLSDGFLLRPLAEMDFETLELRVEGWAVDGVTISSKGLRELLGDEAVAFERLIGSDEEPRSDAESRSDERIADVVEDRVQGRSSDVEKRKRLQGRTAFFSGSKVDEDESVSEVVVIFGPLEIDGEVRGDAVVVGGSVKVRGLVQGDLTVVGGSADLRSGAKVYGDVVSVGGEIETNTRSQILGERTQVAIGSFGWDNDRWDRFDFDSGWGPFSLDEAFEKTMTTLLLSLMILFLYWIARDYVESVGSRAEREPWKAGLVGLLFQIFFVPALLFVLVILVVSIVGIPLAILLVPVSFMILFCILLLGYAAVALLAGRFLERRFGWRSAGPFWMIFLGVLLIQGWSVLGEALLFIPGPVKISAFLLLFIGGLIKYVSWTVGLGAVLLRQFAPIPQDGEVWTPSSPATWEPVPSDPPPTADPFNPSDRT